jgi:hypothetical protein
LGHAEICSKKCGFSLNSVSVWLGMQQIHLHAHGWMPTSLPALTAQLTAPQTPVESTLIPLQPFLVMITTLTWLLGG